MAGTMNRDTYRHFGHSFERILTIGVLSNVGRHHRGEELQHPQNLGRDVLCPIAAVLLAFPLGDAIRSDSDPSRC